MSGGDSLLFTFLGRNRISPALKEAGDDADKLATKLDSFGKAGVKALGGVAVAGIAAGAAGGAALVGLTVLFAGLTALIVSGNAEVASSYAALSSQVSNQMRAAAAPLAPYFVNIAGDLSKTANMLGPLMTRAFAAGVPPLRHLTDGVSAFALNAMPGFVRGVERSEPALIGMRNLLGSTGQGLGDFFDILGQGSTSTGTVLTGLGSILQTVLRTVGVLVNQLSDAVAGNMDKIVGTFQAFAAVATMFGGGALPMLGVGLNVLLTVFNGLAIVLEPIAGLLGGVTGAVLSFLAAFRLMSAVTGIVTSVDAALGGLNERFKATEGGGSRFSRMAGGLLGVLGGPFGAVLAAATIGLGLLGLAQDSAAEKAAEHTAFVDALTASLRESSGAIDASTRKTVASNSGVKEAIANAKEFGISQATVVDAVLGQGSALDEVRRKLEEVTQATKIYATEEVTGELAWTGAYRGQGQAAADLLGEINRLNGSMRQAQQDQADYGKALQSTGRSMLETTSAGGKLASATEILKDTASDAESRLRALRDIVDSLSGDSMTLEGSQARLNSQLLSLKDLAGTGTDRMQGWGNALVDVTGKVDTFLPNGQSLFNSLRGVKDEAISTAQATYDLAIANGETAPQALAKAAASMQLTRDAVIKYAREMQIGEDRAKALADRMGLLPELTELAIAQPGMTEAQRELSILKGRIDDIPGRKSVVVESLSDEARKKLEDLGYQVKNLPGGKVQVFSNTDPAWAKLNEFLRAQVNKTVTVTSVMRQQTQLMNHDGNVVRFAQGGLFGRMTYFSAGAADVHAPNTWRVTGDRSDVNESYIPWNNSPRSRSILATTARALGFSLTPLGTSAGGQLALLARGGGGAGMSVVIQVNGAQSPMATAQEIRRALLELQRDLGTPIGVS